MKKSTQPVAQLQSINLKEIFAAASPLGAPIDRSTAIAPYVAYMTSKEASKRMGPNRKKSCTRLEVMSLFVDALLPRKASIAPQGSKNKQLWMHVIYDKKIDPGGTLDKDKARGVIGEAKDRCTADFTSAYAPHQSSLHLNAAIAHSETRRVRA